MVSACLAVLLQAMPPAFSERPAETRDAAPVVVTGEFSTGRSPCEWLPDCSRRWMLAPSPCARRKLSRLRRPHE
jgi:uncharacterized membrane protein